MYRNITKMILTRKQKYDKFIKMVNYAILNKFIELMKEN